MYIQKSRVTAELHINFHLSIKNLKKNCVTVSFDVCLYHTNPDSKFIISFYPQTDRMFVSFKPWVYKMPIGRGLIYVVCLNHSSPEFKFWVYELVAYILYVCIIQVPFCFFEILPLSHIDCMFVSFKPWIYFMHVWLDLIWCCMFASFKT